jgi:kinesin family protein 4/21/27
MELGIIPRAAQYLFEKLEGPSKHNRNSSTGLRTPARYSISSTSSFGKGNAEKNWQMKATYVEVGLDPFSPANGRLTCTDL